MKLAESDYTPEQEAIIYDRNLQDVYDNPRWYLDHLDELRAYMVSWENYVILKNNKNSIVLPYKYVNHRHDKKKKS